MACTHYYHCTCSDVLTLKVYDALSENQKVILVELAEAMIDDTIRKYEEGGKRVGIGGWRISASRAERAYRNDAIESLNESKNDPDLRQLEVRGLLERRDYTKPGDASVTDKSRSQWRLAPDAIEFMIHLPNYLYPKSSRYK